MTVEGDLSDAVAFFVPDYNRVDYNDKETVTVLQLGTDGALSKVMNLTDGSIRGLSRLSDGSHVVGFSSEESYFSLVVIDESNKPTRLWDSKERYWGWSILQAELSRTLPTQAGKLRKWIADDGYYGDGVLYFFTSEGGNQYLSRRTADGTITDLIDLDEVGSTAAPFLMQSTGGDLFLSPCTEVGGYCRIIPGGFEDLTGTYATDDDIYMSPLEGDRLVVDWIGGPFGFRTGPLGAELTETNFPENPDRPDGCGTKPSVFTSDSGKLFCVGDQIYLLDAVSQAVGPLQPTSEEDSVQVYAVDYRAGRPIIAGACRNADQKCGFFSIDPDTLVVAPLDLIVDPPTNEHGGILHEGFASNYNITFGVGSTMLVRYISDDQVILGSAQGLARDPGSGICTDSRVGYCVSYVLHDFKKDTTTLLDPEVLGDRVFNIVAQEPFVVPTPAP